MKLLPAHTLAREIYERSYRAERTNGLHLMASFVTSSFLLLVVRARKPLVASLLLVARPGAPSSVPRCGPRSLNMKCLKISHGLQNRRQALPQMTVEAHSNLESHRSMVNRLT